MFNQLISKTQPLTDDQLMHVAPSIFATAAHESRSARYAYVPTVDVLNGLRREGFQPFAVAQSRTRDASRREYTKHMMRFRKQIAPVALGEEIPEIILINSHDGSSSYQMMAGMFRLVCLNGMVVASSTVDEIRIPHQGDIVGRVIEGAYSVVKEFDRVIESSAEMKAVTLNEGEQNAFAHAALVAKYGEPETGAFPVTEEQVLRPRRHDDVGNDLWRVFNRTQESLVRGGLRSRSANGRRMRTREVTGISQNVQLNRALWTLAESMKQIKAAA